MEAWRQSHPRFRRGSGCAAARLPAGHSAPPPSHPVHGDWLPHRRTNPRSRRPPPRRSAVGRAPRRCCETDRARDQSRARQRRPTTHRRQLDEGALSPKVLHVARSVGPRAALEKADELFSGSGRQARPGRDRGARSAATFQLALPGLRDPSLCGKLALRHPRTLPGFAQAHAEASRDRPRPSLADVDGSPGSASGALAGRLHIDPSITGRP
ncbi:MAG: hypothetical protein QOF11_2459 [Chloroflexota bacterium]|jgi:hypothetical protein|nr:hypothetical protein [Chloroflexota bacterium]